MKKFNYYKVGHVGERYRITFLKKENAEKYRDKLNKKYGDIYVVDKITLIFKDGE